MIEIQWRRAEETNKQAVLQAEGFFVLQYRIRALDSSNNPLHTEWRDVPVEKP